MKSIPYIFFIFLLLGSIPIHAADNTKNYYIDSVNGNDNNSGLTQEKPWKSLKKVSTSNFKPGTNILFRRDREWRGTLVVKSSGIIDNPIKYSAYGTGSNPLILRTSSFNNWKLINLKNNNQAKIWLGTIPNVKNSWGIVLNNKRLPSYTQYADITLEDMKNGYFYSPLNKSKFYLRSDSGHPGAAEIGSNKAAILIDGKHHVIIENIDTFGPGGRKDSGSSTGYMNIMITGDSSYITLKDMEISHSNSIGISSKFDTANITYENLISHDNTGTGIYMNGKNGRIINCKSYDNGRVIGDKGDRGGIGSFKGSNILIEGNEVFNNGPDVGYADFEISIVGTGKVEIKRNYVHDCLQGCIQIAEGGDNSSINYNIISGFNSATGKAPSPGIFSGIRIGGGKQGSKNISIYNNVIHGEHNADSKRGAALYMGWYDNSGISVKNNIFSNNKTNIYVNTSAKLNNSVFTNNLFATNTPNLNIIWKNKNFNSLLQWKNFTRYGNNYHTQKDTFENKSTQFTSTNDFKLRNDSIAIKKGASLGTQKDYTNKIIRADIKPDIGAIQYLQQ